MTEVAPVWKDERYSRQTRFAGLGEEGQKRLANSRVAIVGCGALGTAQAELLARAGVGTIRVIDRDYVERSNLQRQLLFDEQDAASGLPKAIAAANHLRAINTSIAIDPVVADLVAPNAEHLLSDVQLILDGTDNFETRYLLNDFAIDRNLPWVYGAAVGSFGMKMPVIPGRTCCLSCMKSAAPTSAQPTCETSGVLGSITAVIGALQVADALKILACGPESVAAQITTIDVWSGEVVQFPEPPANPECSTCGRREFPYLKGGYRAPITLCGHNAVQIYDETRTLDLRELAERLQAAGSVRANDFALRFDIPPYQMTIFPDGRAIIKGTVDIGVARSLYSKYIGD